MKPGSLLMLSKHRVRVNFNGLQTVLRGVDLAHLGWRYGDFYPHSGMKTTETRNKRTKIICGAGCRNGAMTLPFVPSARRCRGAGSPSSQSRSAVVLHG